MKSIGSLPFCTLKRAHVMLFWLLPVPLCVTQKIPVYDAPERLVGDFSFSICFGNQNGSIRGAPHTPGGVGTFSVNFQLTGSPLVGNRRVGIAEKCSLQTHSHSVYKPFSYSISSHTYCFYFGCECLCVLRMSFALSRCIADPETTPVSQLSEQRASQRPF